MWSGGWGKVHSQVGRVWQLNLTNECGSPPSPCVCVSVCRLAYKLTYMYYNWPGTIRVPAPCQVQLAALTL